MSQISFENFALRAQKQSLDPTQIAGRYLNQKNDERNILIDIINKLNIVSTHNCLEIGCNVGNILIPLSFLVNSIVGIDHPACLAVLKERFTGDNVRLIGENFLDCDTDELGRFDIILVYSVLHYLADAQEVYKFIDKALSLLEFGGKLLLGDIPNI